MGVKLVLSYTLVRRMRGILLVTSLVVCLTNGLFFGTPNSECSLDSQCPSFGRSECLQRELLIFCTRERLYRVPGRCVQRNNFLCDVGNAINGNRRQSCGYTECAQCLTSSDCSTSQTRRDYKCRRRSRRRGSNRLNR